MRKNNTKYVLQDVFKTYLRNFPNGNKCSKNRQKTLNLPDRESGIIAAPQQMCNVLHKNLKEKTMFDFTKTTKQFEELAERIKEVNEFWINSVLTSTKEFFKTVKTK